MSAWLPADDRRERIAWATTRLRAVREHVSHEQHSVNTKGFEAERAATLVLIDQAIAAAEELLAATDAMTNE